VTYLLTLPHKLNNSLKEWVISFSCKTGKIKDMMRKEVVNAISREEKNKQGNARNKGKKSEATVYKTSVWR
jgi:hypothetical protein